jgi:hypothetical protein
MQRFKFAGCTALMLMAAVSAVRSEDGLDPFTMAEDPQIHNSLVHLSDPDPTIRTDAVQRLRNLGEFARPACRRALAGATPQVRAEIDQVLVHIPWIKPGDSEEVENILTGYAEKDPEGRCEQVQSLGQLQNAAVPPLLRVLQNDPSQAVRWEAAAQLQLYLDTDAATQKLLIGLIDGSVSSDQSYLPAMQNIPLVALAGWACRLSDPARATRLITKAIDSEQEHPTAFAYQTEFAYSWLVDRAIRMRDHARIVELYRQQADRAPWDDDRVPAPITRLFAAQVEYGPFPGFADDLRTYDQYFTHPEMVYILGKFARRQGHPQVAAALDAFALALSGDSANDHYMVAQFLMTQSWDDAADRELKAALRLSPANAANIYFELSLVADDRDDDLSSAKYMELFLQKTDIHDPQNADLQWAEVHLHYLRAARTSNDLAGVKLHLNKLLELDQQVQILQREPGLAADIVPALQAQGRNDQANAIFDAAYLGLKEKMNAAPADPMQKNNLAWLCACSGKKLDEAVKLATEAVAADPDNAACLDTQAEAYLRIGQPSKAVEIETHAIEIKPDDVYMQKQIERFKKAAGIK